MKRLWIVLALAALSPACKRSGGDGAHGSASEHALREMTVDELSRMIEGGERVAVFDANGRPRYEEGHIPGARYVGHDPVTAAVLPEDRATKLVFYCYNER